MTTFDEVREERERDEKRMAALHDLIQKLIECELGDDPGDDVEYIREFMSERINPVDALDALVSASTACKDRADRLATLAQSLSILLEKDGIIEQVLVQ